MIVIWSWPLLKSKADSPLICVAEPEAVRTLLSTLPVIVIDVIPVRFEPSPYNVSKYPLANLLLLDPMSKLLSDPGLRLPDESKNRHFVALVTNDKELSLWS